VSHFRRVSVRALGDEAEPLRARLLDLVPAGLEERALEDGDVELSAYVPADAVERLLAALPDAAVEDVPDGWEDAWRAFHHPVEAGGLWLGPPWEAPPASTGWWNARHASSQPSGTSSTAASDRKSVV